MPSSFSPVEAAAGRLWLNRLERSVRSRGEGLAIAGMVVWHEWNGRALTATVQGGDTYELEISFKRGCFQESECSCPYAFDCKHAAAAMLTMLNAPAEMPAEGEGVSRAKKRAGTAPGGPADEGSLMALAQARAGKTLSAAARAALTVIGAWWRQKKQRVAHNELMQLAGVRDWSYAAVALHGKRMPPRDAVDYLACVDAHLTERGVMLPEPIGELIDRERQAALMEAQKSEVSEKEWRARLRQWATSIPDVEVMARPELRVRLTHQGAVVEWRRQGQEVFVKATAAGLKGLPRAGQRSVEDLILAIAQDPWGGMRTDFRAGENVLAEMVLQFLVFPDLRHGLVGESGAALAVHDSLLKWHLEEEADGGYTLALRDGEGRTPPRPVLIVLSTPAWFVTPNDAWPVERWPFPATEAAASMAIPAAAVETADGAAVLGRLGLPLPPRLEAKIQKVKTAVVVQAQVNPGMEGRSGYLRALAEARFDDGAPLERWTGAGWLPSGQKKTQGKGGTIPVYDRAALTRAASWLASFELKPVNTWVSGASPKIWHEKRITKDFPDQFLQWMAERPQDVIVELDKELASLRDGVVSGTVRLDVEEAQMDWFDLRVALDVADVTLSREEIQLLLKAQGRWVRIEGKGWRKLQFTLTPEQEAELAAMGLTTGDFDGSPQRLHALQLANGSGKNGRLLPAERADAVQRRVQELQTRVQPEVPTAITAVLRPYQLEGFHFLAYLSTNRFGGVLADDMGLGKTVQALTWLAWLWESESKGAKESVRAPVLVVCPKSVQDNWRSEAARFYPGLRVAVWTRDAAGSSGLDGTADLLVINYQQLRQHEEKLSRQPWLAVILDEAQAIKNPTSLSARAACALQAEHRLALSGTPIENRLLDLWSIMGFAMPGVLGNRNHFAKHFDAKEDPFARRRLAARVRPFLLRRTKKEVAKDLPDRTEEDIVCELEGMQQRLYQAELKRARAALLDVKTSKQLDKARFNILTSLLRLRQICCHPALVMKEEAATASGKAASGRAAKRGNAPGANGDAKAGETGSAKLDALLELLEPIMEEGGKVLVFSQFVEMLEIVRRQIVSREWRHFVLTGQTDGRGELVKTFQETEGAAVFLISLKAGGFGLNLTAASYVVLCDPWWNPAVEAQAIDRTHRIGQTQKVNAYRLIVKESIEEKIRMLQKKKSALAHDILGEENFASALTLDDFRYLLGEG